jgi:hypothetical protein
LIFYQRGKVLELGAGRGRVGEYLGIGPNRVVQLDSSEVMFDLPDREDFRDAAGHSNISITSAYLHIVVEDGDQVGKLFG